MAQGERIWIGAAIGRLAGPLVRQGFTLAWLFLALQVPLLILLGLTRLVVLIVPATIVAHTVFIALLTDLGMRATNDTEARIGDARNAPVAAGLVLALPLILLIAAMSVAPATGPSDLPWLPACWVIAAIFALPARLVAYFRGEPVQLQPVWQRLPAVALFALPILFLPAVPATPEGECCGFMEGGLFLLPAFTIWLATWLFGASVTLALLSAASVRPRVEG